MNFPGVTDYPEFVLYQEQDIQLPTSDRDTKLYALGWRPTKEYFISQYGFKEEHFSLLDQSQAPAQHSEGVLEVSSEVKPVIYAAQKNGAIQLSGSVGELGQPPPESSNEAMNRLLSPVIQLMQDGASYEAVNAKLVETFPDMDSSGLEELLTQSFTIADITGRASTA
jgi:phage gp29-like protein